MMLPFLTPTFIIAVLIALSVHEWAHGYVAYKLGDPTAKHEGRLTLNPIAHLDPMGTLLFLFVGFGWGKPVPVNPQYFKSYKKDTALVALAGPVSNLILAFTAFFILLALGQKAAIFTTTGALIAPGNQPVLLSFMNELMGDIIHINLILMAFNLLPIAPLDGSKIIRIWIPASRDYDYEVFMRRGPMILLVLIIAGRAFNLPILSLWISIIMAPFMALMYSMAQYF